MKPGKYFITWITNSLSQELLLRELHWSKGSCFCPAPVHFSRNSPGMLCLAKQRLPLSAQFLLLSLHQTGPCINFAYICVGCYMLGLYTHGTEAMEPTLPLELHTCLVRFLEGLRCLPLSLVDCDFSWEWHWWPTDIFSTYFWCYWYFMIFLLLW